VSQVEWTWAEAEKTMNLAYFGRLRSKTKLREMEPELPGERARKPQCALEEG